MAWRWVVRCGTILAAACALNGLQEESLAPDPSTRFSDNYFDLPPVGHAFVTITNPHAPLRPEDIAIHWR